MLLPSFLFVAGAAVFTLFRLFRARADRRQLWRFAVVVGLAVGLVRAVLACVGWYAVEHTGGSAQVPAFALAMLSWPEAALLPRAPGQTSASTYVSLFLLLVTSSTACIALVAAIAQAGRSHTEG